MPHTFHKDQLLVAGYGVTGRSVSGFLKSQGIEAAICDDAPGSGFHSCDEAVIRQAEYVFKSPGMHALPAGDGGSHVINDVELFFRICKKPAICVTGTNGKSTVVAMVEHILRRCEINALACGNYGLPVLDAYQQKPDTYVIELSSYQLENIHSISSVSSVVLNVGVDHVDRYTDIFEYQDVKENIYSNASVKVAPIDHIGKPTYGDDIAGYQCLLDGREKALCEYVVRGDGIYKDDALFCTTASLLIRGKHNALNFCAALALCEPFDLLKQQLIDAACSFKGLPHRMEFVCEDDSGITWINDSKSTNTHSLRAALESMGDNICLIAGGYGKGEDYSDVFSQYAEKISYLVLFGKEAERMYQHAKTITNKVVVDDVKNAVNKAVLAGKKFRTVLFSPACASFDLYKDYVERGNDYKSLVRRACSC